MRNRVDSRSGQLGTIYYKFLREAIRGAIGCRGLRGGHLPIARWGAPESGNFQITVLQKQPAAHLLAL
jgi:hypothetical protein